MGENQYMIMDESIRAFEPGEPGYDLFLSLGPKFEEIEKRIQERKEKENKNNATKNSSKK